MKEEITQILKEYQWQIALSHPEEKADLFIEFLQRKKELEDKIEEFELFIVKNFKEELQ